MILVRWDEVCSSCRVDIEFHGSHDKKCLMKSTSKHGIQPGREDSMRRRHVEDNEHH